MAVRLQKLKLCNFRCFGPVETTVDLDNMTALIGANSSGKTALLHALVKLFGVNREERLLHRSDFHVPPDKSPDELESNSLYIEAVLTFPELTDESHRADFTVPPFFNQMVVSEPGKEPYVRLRLTAEWARSASMEGDIDSRLEFILEPEDQNLTENSKRVSALPHQRSQIQVIYVPAVRDPEVHLKAHSSSVLWRLLRAVRWQDSLRREIESRFEDINNLFLEEPGVHAIRNTIQSQWVVVHDDDRYSVTDVEFSATELEDILKRVQITFSPTPSGRSYRIDQLGDGLRSLFYLSLVSTLLEIEDKLVSQDIGISKDEMQLPALTILAVEEPENHLSPHLFGRVVNTYYDISEHLGAQVIITSHTPALLNRVNPKHIRHLRIDPATHSTVVRRIKLPPAEDEAYKYIKEAVQAYPEMYFSKVVVLGEGDSEEIVLKRVIEASGQHLDSSQISVVPLGGRHVNHLWKLLNELKIPHVTLLDLDRERPGGGWGRIQYALKQLLDLNVSREEILGRCERAVLSDVDLEGMSSWDVNRTVEMNEWLERLRKYDIFFSAPLDLDFMMLTAFPDEYKNSYDRGRGPTIPESPPEERLRRLERAIESVLKKPDGRAQTYSDEQVELFPWYSYLFLGRGKPATHIAALRSISDEELVRKMPEPLRALIQRVSEKLRGEKSR